MSKIQISTHSDFNDDDDEREALSDALSEFESFQPSQPLSECVVRKELLGCRLQVPQKKPKRKRKAPRSSLFMYTGKISSIEEEKNEQNSCANDMNVFKKLHKQLLEHSSLRKSTDFGHTKFKVVIDYLVVLPIEILLKILITPILFSFYYLMLFGWFISMILSWIDLFFGFFSRSNGNVDKTRLTQVLNCVYTEDVKRFELVDFVTHRAPTYLSKFCFDIPYLGIHYLCGGFNNIQLLNDEGMMINLQMGPLTRMWNIEFDVDDVNVNKMTLDLSSHNYKNEANMYELQHFPGNYLNVHSVEINNKEQTMCIVIKDENNESSIRVFRPTDKTDKNYDKLLQKWELAKAHLQCVTTWYNVAWAHNWVHFHFLDIVAARSGDVLPLNSILGTLINPHVRFTSVINMLGPGDTFFEPQIAKHDWMSKLIPWKVQSTATQIFRTKVAENTATHYLQTDETNNVTSVREDAFPPQWVTDRNKEINDDKYKNILPYLDVSAEYYYVIEKFIKSLWNEKCKMGDHKQSLIEKDIYFVWIRHIEQAGLPGISNIDPVKVLSTLIWTSIQHTMDHVGYTRILENWGIYSANAPWRNDDKWQNILQKQPLKAYKTRSFMIAFTDLYQSWFTNQKDLLTSPHLYNGWKNVLDYRKQLKLNLHHQEFLMDMSEANRKWKWAFDIDTFPASVCF